MTLLTDYNHFAGRHYETGTIQNHFAHRGVIAPHTGQPMTEALLLGISGGIVFGYFSFAYDGIDPFVALLSRNTFDPWDTTLSRLGVVQNVVRTAKADKAQQNLLNALEEGVAPIVLADFYSFEYNVPGEPMSWGMFPLLVYGVDGDVAHLADRAAVGLTCSAETLQTARGRIKKDKHQLTTLEAPDFDKLPAAVTEGINFTISIFTEKPPKGSKNNFGFNAYQHWVKLLTKPKQRGSWEKEFPIGIKQYSALTSSWERIAAFGQASGGADRHNYADFLDEANIILSKPTLSEAAAVFRRSADAWRALETILLPDEIAPFAEARNLLIERRDRFINEGNNAIERRKAINQRLSEIRASMESDFPLSQTETVSLRENIADNVQTIADIEMEGIGLLKEAMMER